MLGGIDDDPGVSAPDGQVAGLRICYSAEVVDPFVEVGRGSIVVGEAGAFVQGVNEVRAIGRVMGGMQGGTNDRQSLMPSQRPGRSRLVLTLLCQRGRDDQQAEQKE